MSICFLGRGWSLDRLANSGGEDEDKGPDPDTNKDLLEDALVLLGNANFRLNAWRQKCFSEFLTEVGKRTLREGIPADKHLFPDNFHACKDREQAGQYTSLVTLLQTKREGTALSWKLPHL